MPPWFAEPGDSFSSRRSPVWLYPLRRGSTEGLGEIDHVRCRGFLALFCDHFLSTCLDLVCDELRHSGGVFVSVTFGFPPHNAATGIHLIACAWHSEVGTP